MPIDPGEVLRMAHLARLRIEPEEAERLGRDLQRIVDFIDGLRELDAPGDDEAMLGFDSDVHREDRAGESFDREDALFNAPDTDGTYFLVPKILDREDA